MEKTDKFVAYTAQLKAEHSEVFRFWKNIKRFALVVLMLTLIYEFLSITQIGNITGLVAVAVQVATIGLLLNGDKKARIGLYVCAFLGFLSIFILNITVGLGLAIESFSYAPLAVKYMMAYELLTPFLFLISACLLTNKKATSNFVEVQKIRKKQMEYAKTL